MSTLAPALAGPPEDLARFRGLLARVSIFQGLTPDAIDDLCGRLQVRARPAGAILVAEDEAGDAMYVIAEGQAKVALFGENGREITLSVLRPGDFFGEMALFDGRPRSANVVAMSATTLLCLPREAFLAHIKARPQTALRLLAEMSGRLRKADDIIANLALHDVEARLVRTLIRLAHEDGEQREEGLLLRRRPTQQDLANMVGSCRETVSRTFAMLVRRGVMEPRGRGLLLTPKLVEMARPHPDGHA
ncbi:MAG TPA: Crp/Fnr family transcriptional regulator [Polyangia bacterium]|nr:Crp/Fnr family transcriptional regulator [Polyangia bacterium]